MNFTAAQGHPARLFHVCLFRLHAAPTDADLNRQTPLAMREPGPPRTLSRNGSLHRQGRIMAPGTT